MKNTRLFILLLLPVLSGAQEIVTEYLVADGDTLDVFAYQLPLGYTGEELLPLAVCFHHWNGSEQSCFGTEFDDEAYIRGWLFLSPWGGSGNHYHHQGSQALTEQEILWMMEHFPIDSQRIYMIGGSMGGGGGLIYSNNHLDPEKPMVAAAVSGSGILDCERRWDEMDGNNSMLEWFGGSPDQVPFEYHRNSAVFFEEPDQSMHLNLQYLPLYLDFAPDEPHRFHAEDLDSLLTGYNPDIWIETDPEGGHGWSALDAVHACDWLSGFTLVSDPNDINVNLDEESRAYWAEAGGQIASDDFIRIHAQRSNRDYAILEFDNALRLSFHLETQDISGQTVTVNNQTDSGIRFGLDMPNPLYISEILIDGEITQSWSVSNHSIWLDMLPAHAVCSFVFLNDPADVSGDGIWNVLDIVMTINFIMGVTDPNPIQALAADMNNDGSIDILDIVMMVNLIIGT